MRRLGGEWEERSFHHFRGGFAADEHFVRVRKESTSPTGPTFPPCHGFTARKARLQEWNGRPDPVFLPVGCIMIGTAVPKP